MTRSRRVVRPVIFDDVTFRTVHGSAFSLVVLFIVTAFATFNANAQADPDRDLQIWSDVQVNVPLTEDKKWNAQVWLTGRLGNNVRTVTDARIGLVLLNKVNKFMTLGGGYIYRRSNSSFHRARFESRYVAMAAFTVPLSRDEKWKLANRNMFQYEDRYLRPNAVVLRSRLWLKRSIKIHGQKFEPFVSFEPSYDSQIKRIAKFRTQAGVSRDVTKRLGIDLYYVRQDETENRSAAGTLNGIGTTFRINL